MGDELTDSEEEKRAEARRRFPAFYCSATQADAAMFDSLVLGHAAYSAALKTTRDMEPGLRRPLELLTNHIEQLYLNRRDWVSECATFKALSGADQLAIKGTLFAVHLPD
jgi:hypothetical protein